MRAAVVTESVPVLARAVIEVVDDVTRECLAAVPDTSISGRRVSRALTTLVERRGKPGMIVSDNGTELTSNAILAWSKDHKVEWHYIGLWEEFRASVSEQTLSREVRAMGYPKLAARPKHHAQDPQPIEDFK